MSHTCSNCNGVQPETCAYNIAAYSDKITLFRKFGLHASADALAARDAYREGKTCRTCVHLDSDPRGEPCATCTRFGKWQGARAEQSKPSADELAATFRRVCEGPLAPDGVQAGVLALTDEAIDRLARKHGATLDDDNGMVPAFYSIPMNNLAPFVRAAIASGVPAAAPVSYTHEPAQDALLAKFAAAGFKYDGFGCWQADLTTTELLSLGGALGVIAPDGGQRP